ncbi:MAG: DnaT-like ssDNA-binding protein [Thermoanaerobaculia bacterium]
MFVAEDGTGLSTANSLVSLAYANDYWTDRPSTAGAWATATDPTKKEALMAATTVVCGANFRGCPLLSSQSLPLPRVFPWIDDRDPGYMPTPILEAVCQMAVVHFTSPLTAGLKRGGEVASERAGPLSRSYFPGAPGGTTYRYVTGLLAPFLEDAGGEMEAVLSS